MKSNVEPYQILPREECSNPKCGCKPSEQYFLIPEGDEPEEEDDEEE